MKKKHTIGLIFAVSITGAGVVAYYRGKRDMELVKDTLCYGGIAGVTGSTAVYVYSLSTKAKSNPLGFLGKATSNAGKLSQKGLALLSQINPDQLYAAMKSDGVKIAPVPADPSTVVQDER